MILVGKAENVVVGRCDHRRERDLRRGARRDLHADAQARDRIEHGTGEIGQRPPVSDSDR